MLYRGYSIEAPWPPNSGPLRIVRNGVTLKEFPYCTSDSVAIKWIGEHIREKRK